MKTYITPKARYIQLELEAMIAGSNDDNDGIMTLHADYGSDDYFSNRRNNSIWDNE